MADTGRTVFADGLWADDLWAVGLWATDAPVAVPDVDDPGTSQAAAEALITGDGLVPSVTTAYSSTIPAGDVISQDPAAGTLVAPGSTVTITVSLGEAPVPPTQDTSGGGWWPDYGEARRQRDKRRAELEAQEREQEAIEDAQAREIARLMRENEARDADRADLERLQKLADTYATTAKIADLPKPVRVAILNAQDARSFNALDQMRRVVEQAEEDELLAVTQAVLLALDS